MDVHLEFYLGSVELGHVRLRLCSLLMSSETLEFDVMTVESVRLRRPESWTGKDRLGRGWSNFDRLS